jgi:hypothetical protein
MGLDNLEYTCGILIVWFFLVRSILALQYRVLVGDVAYLKPHVVFG